MIVWVKIVHASTAFSVLRGSHRNESNDGHLATSFCVLYMKADKPFKQIFWQSWRDLVFAHWQVDPALLSSLLPPELEPDLFEGNAYISLVPFRMTDIRSVWLPAIPGTSSTLETNLRTYVKHRGVKREPVPAVWFFSLEAGSTLAVTLARLQYGLPYFKAKMTFSKETTEAGIDIYTAASSRQWPRPTPASSFMLAEF